MSPFVFRIVLRVAFLVIVVASIALYRRLTRPGALYDHPLARRVYLVALVVFNLPWLLVVAFGPARPKFINRHLLTAIVLPALVFLLVQLVLGVTLLLRRGTRALLRIGRTRSAHAGGVSAESNFPELSKDTNLPEVSRRQFLRRAAMATPLVPFGIAASGVALSQRRPTVREMTVPISGLPAAFHGFRIVQLSDIHVGPYITLETLQEYVAQANGLKPDLVALTGDLVNHDPDQYPDAAKILTKLRSTHGAIAILGNHEYYLGVEAPLEWLPRVGIPLLRDDHRVITRQGQELLVVGLDYAFQYARRGHVASRPEDHVASVARALKKRYPAMIALTHHPSDFDALKQLKPDLTLAGHTHGGQLAIGQASLANIAFRYARGHYRDGEQHLYVNSGLGHWLPFRLGCPTEISVFTLVRT